MNGRAEQVSEAELHAYVDGQLEAERREAVVAHLSSHPEDAARVAEWQSQNAALHALFDPILEEEVPAHLNTPRPRRWPARLATAAAYLAIGIALGWMIAQQQTPETTAHAALPERARLAHVAYLPEVRHPVEVEASQSAHLAAWLSKRLGTAIRIPALAEHGFELVGGRLLPGDDQHPAAQFMYQSGTGERITLYVARNHGDEDSAFRYLSQRGQNLLYWVDGELSCALVGALPRERLLNVANQAYHQLETP